MTQTVSKILPGKAFAETSGLTSREAQLRLQKYGFNEPVQIRRTLAILLFASPLVIILIIASAVSAATGIYFYKPATLFSTASIGGKLFSGLSR
jgi:hypothetical protein